MPFGLEALVISAMRGTTPCMQQALEDLSTAVPRARQSGCNGVVLEVCWSGLGKISQAQSKLLLRFLLLPQELVKQQNSYYV